MKSLLKANGFSMVGVLITITMVLFVSYGLMNILSVQNRSNRHSEFRMDKLVIKQLIMSRLNCVKTIAAITPSIDCDGKKNLSLKRSNGTAVFENNRYNSWSIYSFCKEVNGEILIFTRVVRPKGNPSYLVNGNPNGNESDFHKDVFVNRTLTYANAQANLFSEGMAEVETPCPTAIGSSPANGDPCGADFSGYMLDGYCFFNNGNGANCLQMCGALKISHNDSGTKMIGQTNEKCLEIGKMFNKSYTSAAEMGCNNTTELGCHRTAVGSLRRMICESPGGMGVNTTRFCACQ